MSDSRRQTPGGSLRLCLVAPLLATGVAASSPLAASHISSGDTARTASGHRLEVAAVNLEVPWDLEFAPDGPAFATEHGSDGLDEINVIRGGANYGWPLTNGPTGDESRFIGPVLVHHTPPAGATFVDGSRYPEWRGDLLFAGLGAGSLNRVRSDGSSPPGVIEEERILKLLPPVAGGPGRREQASQERCPAASAYEATSAGTRWLEGAGGLQIKILAEASNLGGDEVEVGEITLPRNTEQDPAPHRHGSTEIFYVLSGVLGHSVNGTRHRVEPGMVAIVRPGDSVQHWVLSDEPVRALVIWAPGGEAERLSRVLQERPVESGVPFDTASCR